MDIFVYKGAWVFPLLMSHSLSGFTIINIAYLTGCGNQKNVYNGPWHLAFFNLVVSLYGEYLDIRVNSAFADLVAYLPIYMKQYTVLD